jgi:hypothetical protein
MEVHVSDLPKRGINLSHLLAERTGRRIVVGHLEKVLRAKDWRHVIDDCSDKHCRCHVKFIFMRNV